jgi:hypothetical protein
MNSNFAGISVSKLIFKALRPHSFSLGSFLERTIPFVVIARVFSPFRPERCKQISSRSFLTVGSPPVRARLIHRIFKTQE